MERWKRRLLLLLHRREAAAVRRPRAVGAASTEAASPAAASSRSPRPDPGEDLFSGSSLEPTVWTTDPQDAADGRLTATAMTVDPGGDGRDGHRGARDGPLLDTEQRCFDEYRDRVPPADDFCNFTWDGVLCWPPTRANHTSGHFCPKMPDFDPNTLVLKRCGLDGRWEGRDGTSNASLPQGYTDYTVCLWEDVRRLYIEANDGPVSLAEKQEIAARTRTMEVVGLSVSLAALLVSLAIFFHFRNLRNNRTRIHKNLFIAMLMQVVIRLTLYIDKGVLPARTLLPPQGFVHNTPVLCEASYVLMEYARTAMFLWMFIEGLYLHNMVTVTVFQEAFYYSLYTLIGWGVPAIMTTCWAVTTAIKLKEECFRNYNLRVYFWILEGPRMGVIVLNFLFLLNIIRVLVVKLRQSRTSEMEQVRKAVRAALVLLPLLGITNLTNMMPAPMRSSAWELTIWFYATHFLTSFQGLFIACLYCFLNGEAELAVLAGKD
ncbi:Pigment Dispersing Factor Receptor [Frankliniella occidentalis]|nr:Pigment Dispersing Factor Receptor [Frankliniella occidentalis]